jgi:alpha-tubulin suppressor-like RCC1 family protein
MGIAQKDLYEVTAISGGKDQTLAHLKSGEVLGWGGAGSGRITPFYVDICSSRGASTEPVYVGKPSSYSDISAGYGISLGVSSAKTFIWGFCQVGIGGKDLFSEAPTLVSGTSNISKVVAGQFIFAAIDQVGNVNTWGLNVDGALGRATPHMNASPGLVSGIPPMQDIALGDHFMLALTQDQRVYGWGSNSAGQLGLGHLNSVSTPAPITVPAKINSLAVGSTHVLAVSTDGKVYGWGSNHFGQSSDSANPYGVIPRLIPFPEKITAVAAGMHYSLALSLSGKVYAWGWNGFGQLGLGDLRPRRAPTVIPNLTGVRSIAAGEMHSLAIGKSQMLGWGNNSSKQIAKAADKQMTPFSILDIA